MAAPSSPPEQDGPRQPKRRRTSLNNDNDNEMKLATVQTSRSETIWMPDGNIILQSEDGTQFRVHKSVLALNSSFFRDMFSVVDGSQADEGGTTEHVDGCAIIRMGKEDSKEDWERVLQLLYRSAQLDATTAPTPDLAVIHRVLVFTNKYQFDGVFNDVLNTLSAGFPHDLDRFTRKYTLHMESLFKDYELPCEGPTCSTWGCQVDSLLDVIHTALQLGGACKKILPVAMYLASIALDFSEIRDDKRVTDRDVQDQLINARERMRADLFSKWHPWLFDPDECAVVPTDWCTNKDLCRRIRTRADAEFLRCISSSSGEVFLYALRDLPLEQLFTEEMDDFREILCPECLKQLAKHYKSCRTFMFIALPGYFGLGTWEKLIGEGTTQG